MNRTFITIGLAVTILFLFGCNGSDEYVELSGGYFYRDEGLDVQQILSHGQKQSIYSKIVEYDYNSDFIIALQEPNYNDYKYMLGFELRSDLKKYPTNSSEDEIKSEAVADSILSNENFYKKVFSNKINYWIISNKENTVYGPLSVNEYLKLRNDLGLPNNLRIKIINT